MPRPPRLKASAQPLPPGLLDVHPPHTLIDAHRARTGPRCTRTHTPKHTHEHARARTRLPLRSASYLPCRRGSNRTPGCRHSLGTGSEAGRTRSSGLQFRPRIRWGWPGAGARAGTPRLRPAPPRPAASTHLRIEAWSPIGREGQDCCACELSPLYGANWPGGGCGVLVGK